MKKRLWIITIFIFLFLLSACSSNSEYLDDIPENDGQVILAANNVLERKIIYTVESTFDVNDLNESVLTLKNLINDDEWFDLEDIGSTQATFKIRVKTDRLDTFIDELKSSFQVRSFRKTGEDISLQYQDKTNQINSLNLQITRLNELYEDATLSDMITINQQLSNLEVELMNLQEELNLFDSLIEYSEVNITFYGSEIITRSPFFNRLGNGFITGLKAVVIVLDSVVIALSYLLPFIFIFGSIGYGVFYFRKKYKLKKKSKKSETI